jgi:DNA-binding transcriptional MerR regulator
MKNQAMNIDEHKVLKTNDIAKNLGIAESTVRKYCKEMEKAGYSFRKDETGARVYLENDQTAIFNLINLRKKSGVSLNMAADIVATRSENSYRPTQPVQALFKQVFSPDITTQEVRHIIEKAAAAFEELDQVKAEMKDLKDEVRKSNDLVAELLEREKAREEKEKAETPKRFGFLGLFKSK